MFSKNDWHITEASSRQSHFNNGTVDTIRAINQNGYEITINQYSNDPHLQVFIDHADNSTVGYVSLDELDDYIASHI